MPLTTTKKSTLQNHLLNDEIIIQGARMHNLKNISVAIPKNKLVVVTGVSGSGKSSLTMDTLFAEGQRRYAESLSSYARQFLIRMDKPDVDYIRGICPAIAIEQKVSTRSPRSTVGSMTELLDYLRLLYARAGITISPISGKVVKKDEVSDVVNFIEKCNDNAKIHILAPLKLHSGRNFNEELGLLLQKGFSRIIKHQVENNTDEILRIEDILNQDFSTQMAMCEYFILIDRVIAKRNWEEDDLHRIADSIQTAFYEGDGDTFISVQVDNKAPIYQNFNNRFEEDGITFEEPTPNFFSHNNPYGACPTCEGFGKVLGIDINLVIPDRTLSIYEDAIQCWKGEKMQEWKNDFINTETPKGFPIHKPINELSQVQFSIIEKWIEDFFKMVEENLYKVQYRVMQARYRGRTLCPECKGARIRKDALYVQIGDKNIAELDDMPIEYLSPWFDTLQLNDHQKSIANRILLEINQRLKTLQDVGLGYLTLNRAANTLSGGESQRIQLARFLGSNLTDSLYILDEPSIGLHPRDTDRLIKVLKNLRDLNNTVVVVEHDEMMMQEADCIIDMGPYAAHLGGEIVAVGNYHQIIDNPKSLTGQYLSGKLKVVADNKSKQQKKVVNKITIDGCTLHNLKNIDVTFPLNMLCVVTGVSGSGKTTLVKQTLYPALMQHLYIQHEEKTNAYKKLSGDLNAISHIEMIDQNPIGKSSRSNPVTYIKAYDEIRNLYAKQRIAKIHGYQPKHFSFNVEGGRCDTCNGEGEVVVAMQFLADVHLLCESCKGKRFKDEILEVTYREKNISDVLEMSVDEAIDFFKDEKKIVLKLNALQNVGLGYIKLGQSSDTLSGGEAQRVKLASFLLNSNNHEKILFIFDEPTTGLHFNDINKLLHSFYALIENGHSIIVIEHNTDIIKNADWLIDIGPEGGESGGNLLFSGYPNDLKKIKNSYTAKYI